MTSDTDLMPINNINLIPPFSILNPQNDFFVNYAQDILSIHSEDLALVKSVFNKASTNDLNNLLIILNTILTNNQQDTNQSIDKIISYIINNDIDYLISLLNKYQLDNYSLEHCFLAYYIYNLELLINYSSDTQDILQIISLNSQAHNCIKYYYKIVTSFLGEEKVDDCHKYYQMLNSLIKRKKARDGKKKSIKNYRYFKLLLCDLYEKGNYKNVNQAVKAIIAEQQIRFVGGNVLNR